MKNLGVMKWNLLPFVMRNFNFVGFLVGRVKEVFLWKQSFQLSVRRTQAFLSYLGWAKNEILNLVDLSTLGTSEFNEVYFSERRNFEASHKIPTSKNKFGWRNLQGFGTVKFLFYSSEYLEDLIFSATMPKAKNQSREPY